jgi:ATP-dependent DNA ligase
MSAKIGHPAIPPAAQTRQIRPINEPTEAIVPNPPTYPARPIGGGRLELAPKKPGVWHAEPKYNGWRTLVHCPSGAMWNRHGGRLTIAHEFGNALDQLRSLSNQGLEWADCEALERRHAIGRGTLVVLDWVVESATYLERREFLSSLIETERLSLGEWSTFPSDALVLPASLRDEADAVHALYNSLKERNRALRCDFFEGVVMKRASAPYPIQLRSDSEESRVLVKHRFLR